MHGPLEPDGSPGVIEANSPIGSDDLGARIGHGGQQHGVARSEIDHGHVRGQGTGNVAYVFEHKSAIVIRAQAAHPAVKQLDGLLKPISRGLIAAAARKAIADGWTGFRNRLA